MVKCDHFYLHDARYLLGMFSDSANNSNKFPEPLLVHPDAPPDAERVKNLPLPEPPYGPYNEKPGSPECRTSHTRTRPSQRHLISRTQTFNSGTHSAQVWFTQVRTSTFHTM